MNQALFLAAEKAYSKMSQNSPELRFSSFRARKRLGYEIKKVFGGGRSGGISVKTFWGVSLRAPSSEAASLYYYGALGQEERGTIAYFIRTLGPGDIFYDIGAPCGFYGLLAQQLIHGGEIHIFEASPAIFSYLEKNFPKDSKNIFLNNYAVSEKNGTTTFYDGTAVSQGGSSTLVPEVAQGIAGHIAVEVPSITLERYAERHAAPTVIKMDTEGSEEYIIRGASGMLKSYKPSIIMEVWHGSASRFSRRAVGTLLELGYAPHRILDTGYAERIDHIDFDHETSDGSNYLFRHVS